MKRGRGGISKSTVATPAWAKFQARESGGRTSALEQALEHAARSVRLRLSTSSKAAVNHESSPFIGLPLRSSTQKLVSMRFEPPTEVAVAGSFMLDTMLQADPTIDLSVRMPASCFSKGDHRQYQYHDKKILYMRRLALALQELPFAASVEVDAVQHDILRPALVITPDWDRLPSSGGSQAASSSSSSAAAASPTHKQLQSLRVRVLVGYPADALPDHLLEPGVNNHTRRGHFGRPQVATPCYNFRVRWDSEHTAVLQALHGALSGHRGALSALVVLKDWARRRGLGRSSDGISSTVLTALVAFLAQKGIVSSESPLLVCLRAVFRFLASGQGGPGKPMLLAPSVRAGGSGSDGSESSDEDGSSDDESEDSDDGSEDEGGDSEDEAAGPSRVKRRRLENGAAAADSDDDSPSGEDADSDSEEDGDGDSSDYESEDDDAMRESSGSAGAGVRVASADQVRDHLKHSKIVILSPSGRVNLAALVSADAWEELEREASLALTAVNTASLRDAAMATGCWDVVQRSSKQSVVEAAEQARRGQFEMADSDATAAGGGGRQSAVSKADKASRQIALAEIAAAREAREALPPCIHTMLTTAPEDAVRLVFGELASPSERYDRVSGVMAPPSPFEVAAEIIRQAKLQAPKRKKIKGQAGKGGASGTSKAERLAGDQETMLWHHVAAADADTLTDQLWPETFRERVGRVVAAGLSKWTNGVRILPAYSSTSPAAASGPAAFSPADAVQAQAENSRQCGFSAPSKLLWTLDQSPPVAKGVWICVNLDAKESTSNVIRGPSAEDKAGAARFRHVWGSKAELRRFKDGSIIECAAFPAPLRAQQGLYHRALTHLLRLHLSVPPDGVVTPGLPLEATLERAQLPFAAAGGQGQEVTGWATSSTAAAQSCGRALDRLRVCVTDIAERLSLRVASVIASDAGPRGTLRLPIAPHPLAGAATAERAALEPWMGPSGKVAKAAGLALGAGDSSDSEEEGDVGAADVLGAKKRVKGKKGKKKDVIVSRIMSAARSMCGAGAEDGVEKVLLATPKASNAVPVTDVVLRLEDSQQWPVDPAAIAATKTAFYLQIGRQLDREYGVAGRNKEKGAGQQHGMIARAAGDYLMVLVDGYAFRCRIHVDREVSVLRRMAQPSFTGALDTRSLENSGSSTGIVDTSRLLELGKYESGAVTAVPDLPKAASASKGGAQHGGSFSVISSSGKGAVAKTDLRDKISTDADGYAVTPGGLPTKIKMLSVEDALGRAAELELHGYRRPRHASQMQAFQLRTPGFVGAVRLTQQWLASIGAELALPIEAVELIVASVYTEPRPFLPPSTASAAFLRVLRLIGSFEWNSQALFVDIDSSAALDTKKALGKARKWRASVLSKTAAAQQVGNGVGDALGRMAACSVFLVTPEDVQPDGSMRPYWTSSSPGAQEWGRVVVAARLSHGLLLRSRQASMDPLVLWEAASMAEGQQAVLDPSLRMHGPKTEAVQGAVEAVVVASGASSGVARKMLARVERQVRMHAACEPVGAASRASSLLEASRLYTQALRQADGVASDEILHGDGAGAGHAGVVATCMSVRARLASQGDEVGAGGFRPVQCLGQRTGSGRASTAAAGEASSGAGTSSSIEEADSEPSILSDWVSLDASDSAFPPSCAAWLALFRPQRNSAEGDVVVSLAPELLPRRDGFNSSPPSRIPATVLASRLAANVYRGDAFKLFECFAGTLPPESVRGVVSCSMLPGMEVDCAGMSGLTSHQQVFASAKASSGKVSVRQQLRFDGTVERLVRLLQVAARSATGDEDVSVSADMHHRQSIVVSGTRVVGAAERPARRLALAAALRYAGGNLVKDAVVRH